MKIINYMLFKKVIIIPVKQQEHQEKKQYNVFGLIFIINSMKIVINFYNTYMFFVIDSIVQNIVHEKCNDDKINILLLAYWDQ